MMMIKSPNDGCWYPDKTEWKYVLDSLCNALGYFSEEDTNSKLYIIINHVADDVSDILKNSKNEC